MKAISTDKAVSIALEQHRAGQFERAESLYLEILRQDPGNVDAMHLLGVLAHQGHDSEAAVKLIRAAISRRSDVPVFHYNLAEALRSLGKLDDAMASYRRAIEIAPEYFEAHNNLGMVLNEQRKFLEAQPICRAAIEMSPQNATPLNNLGNSLRGLRRWDEAERIYREAISLRPDFVEAINNLGMLFAETGRLEESLEQFRRAVQLGPGESSLHLNLGAAYTRLRMFQEAVTCFQTAVSLDPKSPEANNNMGAALRNLGQAEHAVPHFEKAIELNPEFLPARANLAGALKEMGKKEEALTAVDAALEINPALIRERFLRAIILRDMFRMDEAIDVLREVLSRAPDDVPSLTAIGYALLERGELDEAMSVLKRSIELKPDSQTHSNVLLTINYHPGYSPATLLMAHQSWAELHETPRKKNWHPHLNDPSPDRKLRIGYVSPDFRGHVVAHFLEPVLDHHDHDAFEIYGYAHLTATDIHTWRLRSQIDHWREIAQASPDRVAEMIREDQIDILVELAGHTANNALPVFARKPAPVQINMIGFPSTTGLSAMDYRITDELCDPTGVTDAFNTEKLIRLPGLFWCYQPSEVSPDVGPLPAEQNGFVTFTSVNNFTKVTPAVQHLWARILAEIPDSRLILQTAALTSKHLQKSITKIFAEHGVSTGRLDFRTWTDMTGYLNLLNQSDMTLDPFPFNGGTTTCHSLWMGAPVITLAGDRHASRMGLSMMTAIGLPEFVAHTPDEYVQIARMLTGDLPRLAAIRAGMRDRLIASPLLDAKTYTKNLESSYRRVWRKWCDEHSVK